MTTSSTFHPPWHLRTPLRPLSSFLALPLLKLNPLQVSLEDVFMELTQSDRAAEEYAEKAKKKETEDMKDAGDL